jgi:hypothetical protein
MGAHPISAAVSASVWGDGAISPYSSYGQKTGERGLLLVLWQKKQNTLYVM